MGAGAWEEEADTCTVQWTLDCDQANHDGGSDFICECAEVLDGAQACNVADWPDKDHGVVCRDCKVLVDRFSFYTRCSGYSATVGRRCTGACEEARADFDDYSSAEFRCKRLSALRILRLSDYSRLFDICRLHFYSKHMMMVSGTLSGMRAIGWRSFSSLCLSTSLQRSSKR